MLPISLGKSQISDTIKAFVIGFSSLCFWAIAGNVFASDAVQGNSKVFQSPHGVEERCVALSRMPHGVYTDDDRKWEDTYCAIDIYDQNVAVCPKLRSTSPATFIYDLRDGEMAGKQLEFEKSVCPRGEIVVKEANAAPTDFKITMNAKNASATFSTASLLYYHFSRYFDTYTYVPVSVFRTVDRISHEERISSRGLEWSGKNPALKMNHAAWLELDAVEKKPLSYAEPYEVFTSDLKQVYGVLMRIEGKRYGEEVNGTRKSGWGKGQSYDFQQTPPFVALRSEKPLHDAIASAVAKGFSAQQIVYWMQELSEITLLDFIFSQQDRVGNIDFVEYWHEAKDGQVVRTKTSHDKTAPSEQAVLLKRTYLNDNDAAGKRAYANYTKSTGMLEAIRHYNPKTYQRLQYLAGDIEKQGPLHSYVKETFGLTDAQFQQAANNIKMAAGILYNSCKAKKLRFDLDPDRYFLKGDTDATALDCESPKDLTS